jgi:hypothetical protein
MLEWMSKKETTGTSSVIQESLNERRSEIINARKQMSHPIFILVNKRTYPRKE